jgi:hypothetical protein
MIVSSRSCSEDELVNGKLLLSVGQLQAETRQLRDLAMQAWVRQSDIEIWQRLFGAKNSLLPTPLLSLQHFNGICESFDPWKTDRRVAWSTN